MLYITKKAYLSTEVAIGLHVFYKQYIKHDPSERHS